jgi:hypothetical protein
MPGRRDEHGRQDNLALLFFGEEVLIDGILFSYKLDLIYEFGEFKN